MSDFANIWRHKPTEKMLFHILYLTLKVFYSTAQVNRLDLMKIILISVSQYGIYFLFRFDIYDTGCDPSI